MLPFKNKILFVGYGAVAECTLPILFKHLKVPAKNVTVMDFADKQAKLAAWIKKGVRYLHDRVTEKNMTTLLAKHVGPGDILIDLAWNIDACEILQWCHDNGVRYINTSTELWDPYAHGAGAHPTTKTLYYRHMNLRRMLKKWKTKGPTAVIEHGANPGLISHFVKQGLIDIGNKLIKDKKATGKRAKKITGLIAGRQFNVLAQELGVKVIHCSERDTQITDQPKQVDEFVNTWSIEGFREEGVFGKGLLVGAPAHLGGRGAFLAEALDGPGVHELVDLLRPVRDLRVAFGAMDHLHADRTGEVGWGTHEKKLPKHAFRHQEGPKNQICLAQMGINTWVRSWVPDYNILGMVVRHGEAFTISDKLTVWKNGKAVYRPTMHYAYCPCDEAIASLNEMRGYNYKLNANQRIMNDEITAGADILGATPRW